MTNILVVFQSVRNSDIIIGNFISHTDKYPVRYSALQKISEEAVNQGRKILKKIKFQKKY